MRSDTDATRVPDCFILDFPCLCEASGQPMTPVGAGRRLRETSIGTPLVATVNPGAPAALCCGSALITERPVAAGASEQPPDSRWARFGARRPAWGANQARTRSLNATQ